MKLTEITRIGGETSTIIVEIDEDMPEDEVLLKFPKGQEHKNIRIVNIGVEEEYVGEVIPLEFATSASERPPYSLTKECLKRLVDEGVLEEENPECKNCQHLEKCKQHKNWSEYDSNWCDSFGKKKENRNE